MPNGWRTDRTVSIYCLSFFKKSSLLAPSPISSCHRSRHRCRNHRNRPQPPPARNSHRALPTPPFSQALIAAGHVRVLAPHLINGRAGHERHGEVWIWISAQRFCTKMATCDTPKPTHVSMYMYYVALSLAIPVSLALCLSLSHPPSLNSKTPLSPGHTVGVAIMHRRHRG